MHQTYNAVKTKVKSTLKYTKLCQEMMVMQAQMKFLMENYEKDTGKQLP